MLRCQSEFEEMLQEQAEGVIEFALLTLTQRRNLLDQVGHIQGVKLPGVKQPGLLLRPGIEISLIGDGMVRHCAAPFWGGIRAREI